jgi:Protein of unknown function (DUF3987)
VTRLLGTGLVTVAESGERKTAADGIAISPVTAYERELVETHRTDHAAYEHQLTAWKAQQREILADKKAHPTKELKERALMDLGPPPMATLDPMLIASEPTYEGLERTAG